MEFLASRFIQAVAHTDEPVASEEAVDASGHSAGAPTLSALIKPGHVPKLDLKAATEVSFREGAQVETLLSGGEATHGAMLGSKER